MDKTISQLIQDLTDLHERQLEQETAAKELLEEALSRSEISYVTQEYTTYIPKYGSWGLEVDGREMSVLPCGLQSGEIVSKSTLLSSLISSQHNLYDANINFNPESEVISRSNFYFAPALAIRRGDIQKVLEAKKVRGYLSVEKVAHRSSNLLVGNQVDPKVIVFSHYDSISTGAIDNASGTALMFDIILRNPKSLGEVLFAFCGNEELSYDEPVYWGHGYREFESEFKEQLHSAKRILVLDSLGHSRPQVITDPSLMKLAFPISAIDEYAPKTAVIAGDIHELMPFYHAENDTRERIRAEHYEQTYELVMKLIGQDLT